MTDTVPVALGARSYDIHIGAGLLAQAGGLVGPLLARPFVAIVTEERVAALHLGTLQAGLAAAGIASEAVIVPPGESTKSMAWLGHVVERLLELKVERDDLVLPNHFSTSAGARVFAGWSIRVLCLGYTGLVTSQLGGSETFYDGRYVISVRCLLCP